MSTLVRAPVSFLLSPVLTASAKLVWMAAQLQADSRVVDTQWVQRALGLSRRAVSVGIQQLTARGWIPGDGSERGPMVEIPSEVVMDHRLRPTTRVLFGALLLTPDYSHPSGSLTREQLAVLAHVSSRTVASAIDQLVQADWIKIERRNRRDRIHFTLTFPALERGMVEIAEAESRLRHGDYGEGLMKEYLTLLVDSDESTDNARPTFLVRPKTKERLEFDRYYQPFNVAFEFHGPQHDRPTKKFTAEQVVEQQERDLIKLGLCARRGITLVEIRPPELTLAKMRAKVGNLLPLKETKGHELLIEYLESESRDYMRHMARL